MDDEVTGLQRAAEFGVRFVPLVVKIRKALDENKGLSLNADEVKTLVEVLRILNRKEK